MGIGHKADIRADQGPYRGDAPLVTVPRFIGSEIYRRSSYGPAHPLRVPRVSTVMDVARAMGWFAPGQYLTSPRAKPAALLLWHDPAYVAALQRAEVEGRVDDATRSRHGLGTTANPVFAEMFRRPATSAGATMLAAELVRDGGVVYAPAGGTHHGLRERANGFCYLNDPVLGMLTLRRQGIRRIAYVDIDAHHCDGVQAAFAGDPEALLISIHEEARWPFTGALDDDGGGNCLNLPVPRGLNDSEMRAILHDVILTRVTAFRPEAVMLQCGADAVDEDPLSRLSLSNNAHWEVAAALRPLSPRYIVLGGGGYNPWSVGRLWSGVWAVLAGHEIPDRLPAPAESVLRALGWSGHSRGRNPPEHWFTTLRDAAREGPVRAEVRDRVRTLVQR
jgi:acetoin utilization protein AcuC